MTGKNVKVVNQAYDGVHMEDLPMVEWERVDLMLDRAAALYSDRSGWLPAHERKRIMGRIAELMRPRAEEFALTIAREGGKPLTDARIEVSRAINGVELAAEEIARLEGKQIPMDLTAAGAGRTAYTLREPIGVVVAISAFNHPLNLIVHQVVPAIATGCPVIVKPASTTPLSCLSFVDILEEAGLPEGWCQAVVCAVPVAERMVTDPRVDFLSFIGSGEIGWDLRSKLAPGTRCTLEHGGVAPVIVAADADLETTIPHLVKGGYYHAGQVCVSVQRVYVDNRIKADFVAEMTKQVTALIAGDPTDPTTEVGPLITTGEVERVEEWVEEAIAGGATCPVGGRRLSDYLYAPTLLIDPPDDVRVSTQEVFGPVVNIYGYDRESEAVARANALPVSFQSAVFTRDLQRAMRLSRELKAAAVMINDHTAFRVDWMPFAGRKVSGLGTGGIGYTMEDLSVEKLVVIKG